MTRSLLLLASLAAIPLLGLGLWCLGHYCDLAEVMVGGFLGAGVAVGGAAVEMSHGDLTFGIVMAVIALILLAAGAMAARDQVDNWSISARDWLAVLAVLAMGGAVAFGAYAAWIWGWVGPRSAADVLAVAIGVGAAVVSRRIWRSGQEPGVTSERVAV